MKFSLKLLLWTMIVMALGFGISGFYLVNYVFQTAIEREAGQALNENSILRFAFETAALNVPAKYDVLQDNTVGQIAVNLEAGGDDSSRLLRLSEPQGDVLYASSGFTADRGLLEHTAEDTKAYRVIRQGERYYIQTGTAVNAMDRNLYLETLRDVSVVFQERALGFSVYRRVTVVMLLCGTLLMHLISSWLTRPIRLLTRATRRMASGEYHYRARKVSRDELGQLTEDFNQMANALEENIAKLEEEIQSREDFVAAFAHELKTPLTSIIGYADMLRSRRLDEEKQFVSASYIYTEGKRLEAMSLRLLDIMVARHSGVDLQPISTESLFDYLYDMYVINKSMKIHFSYDVAIVMAEANLLKSVLINLLDNACKASEPGDLIEVSGTLRKGKYRFQVRDHGIGIPKEEQEKIMQAFYMVDKSRSRSKNGAGLGLALCAEILKQHGSRLEIKSTPGEGTCMSFVLLARALKEEDHEKAD